MLTPVGGQDTKGLGRFSTRATLGLFALTAGAVPFLVLSLLVLRNWAPLLVFDGEVADDLNEVANRWPPVLEVFRAVTTLGGNATAVYVFVLAAAFWWIRGQRRLAAYVAVTGVGLAVLVPLTKALVDRARPVVEMPVADTPVNASFPSGHAMVAVVTWGMLAIVLLPAVRRGVRVWLVAAAVLVVVAVGFSRLVLGVHFVSDVVAGWALGAGWLAVTTASFRGWQHGQGRRTAERSDPLEAGVDTPPLVSSQQRVLPRGWATVRRLAVGAAVLFVVLVALGALVTGPLADTAVGRFDTAVVDAVSTWRTESRSDWALAASALAGTRVAIAVAGALAVIAFALTGAWRPAVFVSVALAGEAAIYTSVSRLVDRSRPDVIDLTFGLPAAASWPSGHAAAAVVVYGALAALVIGHTTSAWRWLIVALPVVVSVLTALSRVYVAAHYPTDVLAGLALGLGWLLICIRFLLLDRDGQPADGATPLRRSSNRAVS